MEVNITRKCSPFSFWKMVEFSLFEAWSDMEFVRYWMGTTKWIMNSFLIFFHRKRELGDAYKCTFSQSLRLVSKTSWKKRTFRFWIRAKWVQTLDACLWELDFCSPVSNSQSLQGRKGTIGNRRSCMLHFGQFWAFPQQRIERNNHNSKMTHAQQVTP